MLSCTMYEITLIRLNSKFMSMVFQTAACTLLKKKKLSQIFSTHEATSLSRSTVIDSHGCEDAARFKYFCHDLSRTALSF